MYNPHYNKKGWLFQTFMNDPYNYLIIKTPLSTIDRQGHHGKPQLIYHSLMKSLSPNFDSCIADALFSTFLMTKNEKLVSELNKQLSENWMQFAHK